MSQLQDSHNHKNVWCWVQIFSCCNKPSSEGSGIATICSTQWDLSHRVTCFWEKCPSCAVKFLWCYFCSWSMSFARSTVIWGSGDSFNSGDRTEWDGKRMSFFSPWKSVFYVHFTSLKYFTVGWMMWNKVNTSASHWWDHLEFLTDSLKYFLNKVSHKTVQFKTLLKCPPFVMRISQIRSNFHGRAVSLLFQWKW